MSLSPERSHELRRLLTALFDSDTADGNLLDDDVASLEQILAGDEVARSFYRRYLELHSMLQYEDRTPSIDSLSTSPPQSADEFLDYVRRTSRQDSWQQECVAEMASRRKLAILPPPPVVPDVDSSYPGQASASPPTAFGGGQLHMSTFSSLFARPWFVLLMLLLSGGIGASMALRWSASSHIAKSSAAGPDAVNRAIGSMLRDAAPMTATLVNVANCRWDPAYSPSNIRDGGQLGPGQSLCLLEGVAEIDCILSGGGVGRFQLEGPSSMMLSNQGMPNLQFGKLAAQISSGFGRYTLDTPMGRVVVPYDASVGVVANANAVELHVFEGEALFEPIWPMAQSVSGEPMKVVGGGSIHIKASGDESLSLGLGKANQGNFASRLSMASSRLEVSDEYVAAIRSAKPLAYWRFEEDTNGTVRNEMDDRLHCRIFGTGVRWHSYLGNRSIEFGSSPEFGCLMTEETLDGKIHDSYTLEAWVKPSHFHHGALLSLVEPFTEQTRVVRTGGLLELCGPVAGAVKSKMSWAYHPGRIRFLHRNPAGDSGGRSCFSQSPYSPRTWQHLVGTKDGETLRLYIDGELAATERDATPIPEGMHVLLGQLYPHDPHRVVVMRPLVGELDEVAIYDHAISEEEIARHYQLARPDASALPLTDH